MFKKFIHVLYKKKITLLFVLLLSFVLGSLISEVYNHYYAKYDIAFISEKIDSDFESYINEENLQLIKDSNKNFKDINIKLLISNQDITLKKDENNIYHLTSKTHYYSTYFVKSSKSVSTRAKAFLTTIITNVDNNAIFQYPNVYKVINNMNLFLASSIAMCIGSLSYLIYLFVFKEKLLEEVSEYDNKILYNTPFHLSYWKSSFSAFKSTKSMVMVAMLFALMIVCKFFSIPTGFANLTISFTFLFFAIISLLYGPIVGFIIGTFSDILGFFLIPTGYSFFLGYTLIAACTGFIYGICLYKKKINFINAFFARLLVNIFMNVILGSICWGIICNYDLSTTIAYMYLYELPKNLIFLIPQSFLLYLVLKACAPLLVRYHFLNSKYLASKSKKQ